MVSRRGFIRVLGTGAVIVAAAGFGLTQCDPMPSEAVAAWKGPGADITDPRVRAIAFALLAPNPHNKQPWMVDLREAGAATFYINRERLLPETDPPSRQIMIGCGAFLALLEMAAAEQGFKTNVTLFPNGPWADGQVGETPLARITFEQGQTVKTPLFTQVFNRQTNRGNYSGNAVTETEAGQIADAIAGSGVTLNYTPDPDKCALLANLARRAWEIEIDTDRTYKESVDVMRITGDDIALHRDGISLHGPFFWWASKTGLFTRENAMLPENRVRAKQSSEGWFSTTKSYAWIVSATNTREDQIAAGRAYLMASLKATELGLAQHPLSQALQEFPEMAGPYAEIKQILGVPATSTVQMFYRIGRASRVELSPRRPLDAIVKL